METLTITNNDKYSISALKLQDRTEYCITACSSDNLKINSLLPDFPVMQDALMLNRFVFAGIRHYADNSSARQTVWLHGDACKDGTMSSVQTFVIAGTSPVPVKYNSKTIGFIYEDEYARYCNLSGIIPENMQASRSEQTREVLEIIASTLKLYDFHFYDIVRTWFFLDKLLEWYDEFNCVRTDFYKENGIFKKLIPASTGIGAANQFGTALICNILAVRPKADKVKIQQIASPLQQSPLNYKSTFSRAVEMSFPTHRTLMISGTAGIAPAGQSEHVGDPEHQIELTMRVVHAILISRQMDWKDLSRGIAYFKNIQDRKIFDRYCRNHNIPAFPLAIAHADICRDDLLFEIELDASKIAAGCEI